MLEPEARDVAGAELDRSQRLAGHAAESREPADVEARAVGAAGELLVLPVALDVGHGGARGITEVRRQRREHLVAALVVAERTDTVGCLVRDEADQVAS